jgi:hypothetical protein
MTLQGLMQTTQAHAGKTVAIDGMRALESTRLSERMQWLRVHG